MKLDLCARSARGASSSWRSIVRTGLFLAGILVMLLVPLASPAQNTINTIVGGGSPLGNGSALTASLGAPGAVVEDAAGNIYVSGLDGGYVLKVNPQFQVSVLAGTGYSGYGINGGSAPASSAALTTPAGLALDGSGNNLFIAAAFSQHVFEVNLASGTLTNFAGSSSPANPSGGFGGDGGPATQAMLNAPMGVAVFGNTVYIADSANNRIRMVAANGTISTLPVLERHASALPPAETEGQPRRPP